MEIKKYISFIEEAEKLKSVVRTAWTSKGRRESTAEHSWRLALFACVLSDDFPELDLSKVLIMSLILPGRSSPAGTGQFFYQTQIDCTA